MKKYTKALLIIGGLAALFALLPFLYIQAALAARQRNVPERNNPDCTTVRRVFDYADVLTDRQEAKLTRMIEKREAQLGLDIVIVTIDEDVGSDPYDSSRNNTIRFAEDFYEYFQFGYDGHMSDGYAPDSTGAGVIYVDNWYDLNGYAESAFLAYRGASGDQMFDRAYELYLNDSTLTELEEDVWEYSNVNPYLSYRRMIRHLTRDMVGLNVVEIHITDKAIFIIPLLAALIFLLVNLGSRFGKKTTDKGTYVQGGKANVTARQDVFLEKHTISRHISSSSGGGGGGRH